MNRASYYDTLNRLAEEANDPVLTLSNHEHAVAKLNAMITLLEIIQFIPRKFRIVV